MKRDSPLIRQWILLRTLSGRRDGIGVELPSLVLELFQLGVERGSNACRGREDPLRPLVNLPVQDGDPLP